MRFRDRADAGRRLAERLAMPSGTRPLVLGLARGGMVVAAEVARALNADLNVLVARKVGAPAYPEFGIGAVGPDGARYFDDRSVASLGLTSGDLDELSEREAREVRRRLEAYRGDRAAPVLRDRVVIVVDDGLATGVTAVAAMRYVRGGHPSRTILAVPVCAGAAADLLAGYVDELVCLSRPDDFRSVGEWYDDFDQTSDREVVRLLAEAREAGYLA